MELIDRKLRIFQMAAELEHFSAAAAALGMTQPNVTQQIAALEKEFGTPLFERNGRSIELTAAGITLKKECRRLFASAGEMERRVGNAVKKVRHYRIGGTMTAGGYVLPALISGFMAENPNCNLSLHVANTNEISDMLKLRILDLALVEGPFDEDFFLSQKLLQDELFAVSAPGTMPKLFSLREYIRRKKRLILREKGSGTRFAFDHFLEEKKIPAPDPDSVVTVTSFDAIKEMLKCGTGITVISELALENSALSRSRFREGRILREMNFIRTAETGQRFADSFQYYCRTHCRISG